MMVFLFQQIKTAVVFPLDIHPGKQPNDWLENKTIEDVSPIENSDFHASRFSFCGGT